jgi:hypothetical protein
MTVFEELARKYLCCSHVTHSLACISTGECEFRKCQVFRLRVNVPSASITSNFDTNRAFLRLEGTHPMTVFEELARKYLCCSHVTHSLTCTSTGKCEFRKCQVFRVCVNVPSASSTSNFDTHRAFLRREGTHPVTVFEELARKYLC